MKRDPLRRLPPQECARNMPRSIRVITEISSATSTVTRRSSFEVEISMATATTTGKSTSSGKILGQAVPGAIQWFTRKTGQRVPYTAFKAE
jgi:hypothetical protein